MLKVDRINYRPIRETVLSAVRLVLVTLRSELMAQRDFHSLNRTAKDRYDRTREIDVTALELYTNEITTRLAGTAALICSEENPGGSNTTNDPGLPSLIFIIDPIDNTDGAIHGSPCYTAISVYSRSLNTVIAAAVGDFFQNEIYYADEELGCAYRYQVDENQPPVKLRPTKCTELEGAYITIYTLKPYRLDFVAGAKNLINKLGEEGRVDCIGGSASLCKVAAGYIDAAVEIVKGFQVYDLFPGAYILMKAEGLCFRPDTGDYVSLSLDFENQDDLPSALKARQQFVATGTMQLHNKIFKALANDGFFNETE